MHAWADTDSALRSVEQTAPKDDPGRKALACYGLLVSCLGVPETLPEWVWLRFVEDRPVSAVITRYLAWCCDELAQLGKKALLVMRDNASWHVSKEVRTWIQQQNRTVRDQGQGVRLVTSYLPTKSP